MSQIDDSLKVSMRFELGAKDPPKQILCESVMWVEKHSPVGDVLGRKVPVEVETEIVHG